MIESARDGFLAQGDLARAAEASALLSRVLFNRGDADASRRAGAEAVDLARKAPLSSSTGQALAQEARGLSLVDRKSEAALSLAREALAIAEDVGDVALASHVWNTIGVTRVDLGDPDGIADLEHSVKIAEEGGHLSAVSSGLNNLASSLTILGRLSDAQTTLTRTETFLKRHGHTAGLTWNDGEHVALADMVGDLDGVFEWAERYFSRPEAEDAYQARPVWACRARALLARGHAEPAVEDAERALARLRETGLDAQVTGGVLCATARCFRATGRVDEAEALVSEALPLLRSILSPDTWDLPLELVEVDRGDEYLRATEGLAYNPWLAAHRAAASGNLAGGSELYGGIGARFAEAWAGLLAAERGDASRVEAALAYFEEQRATPYVQRCRARMQASA